MKNVIFIVLIMSMIQLPILGQQDQGGFIIPNKILAENLPKEQMIFLPESGINFYDAPNGEYRGRIKNGMPVNRPPLATTEEDANKKQLAATIAPYNNTPTLLDLSFFFHTSDDCYYIPFDKQENGFVRIMSEGGEAWISIEDLQKANFELASWMDFYGAIGRSIVPPPNFKCDLKSNPYRDANVLVELDENNFEIQVIAFDENQCCEGNYCYVQVLHFKKHPCRGGSYHKENIQRIYKGWVQVVDEKGGRLMVHHAGGC